jgi:hypothetical protein
MAKNLPSPEEVQAALKPLSVPDLQKLADASRVPFHTLLKIRDGQTENPRLGTVRQFWLHVPKPPKVAPAADPAPQAAAA